jgi:hypothetical protein
MGSADRPVVYSFSPPLRTNNMTSKILTPAMAAAANPVEIRFVHAQYRRLGYSLRPDKVIDLVALEQALAGKDIGADSSQDGAL